MMDREHEHIPEASETSGWEIAADAVVVQVEADLQEYRRMYGPKFARKAIGFPSWLFQLGKKGRPISAQDMREVLREKLGIDMLPETTHDLSEVFGNEETKKEVSKELDAVQKAPPLIPSPSHSFFVFCN